MNKATLLGILLLLTILAAGAWLMLEAATFAGPEGAGDAGSTAAPAAAEPADPAAAEGAAGKGDQTARVAVEAGAPPGAAPSGLAVVGVVVDESGAPLPAATVACSPGMGFDRDALDLGSDLEFDDPARMIERVRALAQQRVEVATDADGRFRIAPPGKARAVELRVRARGHVALSHRADRPTRADVDVGALTVKRGAIVTGRVLDRAGRAVAAASVVRRPRNDPRSGFGDLDFGGAMFEGMRGGGEEAVTGTDGRFELAHVEPGEFSLRARHIDHPAARLEGLVVAAGKTLADLVIVVEPGVTIRGRMVAMPAGTKNVRVQAAPPRAEGADGLSGFRAFLGEAGDVLADAGVDVAERSGVAGPDGAFTLRGLGADRTYRVWATQSGRGFAGNATCSPRVEVASGTQGLELRYEAGVTVTFRVVDAQSGAPIERLWVHDQMKGGGGIGELLGLGARAAGRSREYPDGQVTLGNLRPRKKQTLSLGVEALGFAKLERDGIALPEVGALDLGTLRLEPAPVVHVEVAAGGAPVAGATVRLREQQEGTSVRSMRFSMTDGMTIGRGDARSARTDEDGRCVLNGTPGARVVVSVSSGEHAPYQSGTITLPTRESHRHHAELLRGGSVEVTVVDGKGAPVADAGVEHATPGGSQDHRNTDAEGRATFERLAPGAHRFRLGGRAREVEFTMALRMGGGERQQPQPGWENVDVTDDMVATLRLVKDPGTSLAGIVRENGVPLAGARITWLKGPGEAATDASQQLLGAMAELGGGSRNATTDAAGRYRLTELAAGEHRIRITHRERAMPAVLPVALHAGENALDFELDLTVLRGIVRDSAGKPIAGATVSAAPAATDTAGLPPGVLALGSVVEGLDLGGGGRNRPTATTGADGRFELRGVQGGVRVTVRAQAKGFAPASSAPIEVARGGAGEAVDIQLSAAGRLRVQAMVEGPFGSVQATWAGPEEAAGVAPVVQMLRNGVATLDGLRPGRWKVVVTAMGQAQGEPRFAEVVAGQTAEVGF